MKIRPARNRGLRAVGAALAAIGLTAVPQAMAPAGAIANSFSWAYIGDTPYKQVQLDAFPTLTANVNADPDVAFIAHSGDFKGGNDSCSDAQFTQTYGLFSGFSKPFWYTPGDNDWTDCHRTTNGGSHPLERLSKVRSMYFSAPSHTTDFGTAHATLTLNPQSAVAGSDNATYVENTWFNRQCVTFGNIHTVTSNNGIPNTIAYSGSGATTDIANYTYSSTPAITIAPSLSGYNEATSFPAETLARKNEALARIAADVRWVDAIFDAAIASNSEGVFLMMQAEPLVLATPDFDKTYGDEHRAIRDEIFARADSFAKPVIVAHGDGHVYTVTPSYMGHANITRVENFGSNSSLDANGNKIEATSRWLKFTATCGTAAVFAQVAQVVPQTPVTAVAEGHLALGLLVSLGAAGAVIALVLTRRRRTGSLIG